MIECSQALAGIEASLTMARGIKALAKKLDNAELQNQVADLLQQLAEAKIEGANLKSRVWELEQVAAIEQDLEFDGHVLWRKPDAHRIHPYCSLC